MISTINITFTIIHKFFVSITTGLLLKVKIQSAKLIKNQLSLLKNDLTNSTGILYSLGVAYGLSYTHL
mgnify:CR=1 FL=1